MDPPGHDESIIREIFELLSLLTSPNASENEQSHGEVSGFDDILHHNLSLVLNSDVFKRVKGTYDPEGEWKINATKIQTRWDFVKTCLFLMETMWDAVIRNGDEKTKLCSVAQRKILETTFQFVVCLAVLPYLLPGVGVPPEKKCAHFARMKPEELGDLVKYRRLCFTIDVLLKLRSFNTFHEILISKHLNDLLAALFQLSFAPIKKCSLDEGANEDSLNFESLSIDDNYNADKMTYSLWLKLENDKKRFKNELNNLRSQSYRPLIVRNLMILLYSTKSPRWMRQHVQSMLKELVLEENGVISTVTGIIEINSGFSSLSSQCLTIAKLIAAIFCSADYSKMKLLSAQLEMVLSRHTKQSYDHVFIDVFAWTVNEMLQINPKPTEEHFLDEILNPLRRIDGYCEDEINKAVLQLHGLCVRPSNNTIAVPIRIILPVFPILFFVFDRIKDSVCYLKSPIKELLCKLFLEADQSTLSQLLDVAIFNERTLLEIIPIPTNKEVILTSNGGFSIIDGDTQFLNFDNGLTVIQLMKEVKANGDFVSSLFVYLLKKYVDNYADVDSVEKRMKVVFLLAIICEDSDTLKHVMKNGENIIQFVRELLNTLSEKYDENMDVIRVCLSFLVMVVHDSRKKKDVNWKIFSSLLPSLRKLKNSGPPDIKLLADEVHNLITTRNVIGGASKSLIEVIPQSACEKAIEESCDPLLPVRAHGLMELTTLIKKGDAETLAKKEKIFCVFKENLKDKESFIYLRTIEGLATLASLTPDQVLPLLCNEFLSCSNVEVRLKIGEILRRTVNSLNDFNYSYKLELINTFLNGVKDEDNLVRASSLSNLGEVCLALRSNIEDVLHEVIQCALLVALSDKQVEPRRAAVLLFVSLFQGLKTTMFEVLKTSLSELYRTINRIRSNDADEVVRVHAETALDIISYYIKYSFTSQPAMEKRIYVLDTPH